MKVMHLNSSQRGRRHASGTNRGKIRNYIAEDSKYASFLMPCYIYEDTCALLSVIISILRLTKSWRTLNVWIMLENYPFFQFQKLMHVHTTKATTNKTKVINNHLGGRRVHKSTCSCQLGSSLHLVLWQMRNWMCL